MQLKLLTLAGAMTCTAGFVDAVGYARLDHLYLSFMSGNTTRLGFGLVRLDRGAVILALAVIGLFTLGAAIGTIIGDAAGRQRVPVILSVETILLAAVLAMSRLIDDTGMLMPLAVAMGMQNVLHQSLWKADVGKGFMTGTLVSAGQCLAHALTDRRMVLPTVVALASWCVFVIGVMLGVYALDELGLEIALMIALLVLCSITLFSLGLRTSTG